MTNAFFFDTYALIELYKGSAKYLPYKSNVRMLLHKLNLMEFAQFLIREGNECEAKRIFTKLGGFCVDYDDTVLLKVAEMKTKYSRDKISFIDCLGYILAGKHDVKFLTGDIKFKDMQNVQFVK